MDNDLICGIQIEKVFPSIEELGNVLNNVQCIECKATFTNTSNLTLHLAKTHRKTTLLKSPGTLIKHFHCPIPGCIYHHTAHFKNNKLLKQHYLKIHSAKQHPCLTCHRKSFSTKSALDRHTPYCGVSFTCPSCPACYDCYETLMTHARRKNHPLPVKVTYSRMYQTEEIVCPFPRPVKSSKLPYLLPKSTPPVECSNKSSQTDLQPAKSQSSAGKYAETQTNATKKETTTTKKSIKTQTNTVSSSSKSSNTSLVLEELDFNPILSRESTSSSTQTNVQISIDNPTLSPTFEMKSSQTIVNDCFNTYDENFFNCNMETQTDCDLMTDILDADYYSNMYTQTCNYLFNNELNNICTQTMFDDVLKSVESQTIMSHNSSEFTMCRDLNHMETQTDAEMKELLQVINA